ncbi:MAG: hypothetical protein O3A93_13630 [Chloroflexi bacterium]|nr:hypothetical protein [Chloroflexota bacterium]
MKSMKSMKSMIDSTTTPLSPRSGTFDPDRDRSVKNGISMMLPVAESLAAEESFPKARKQVIDANDLYGRCLKRAGYDRFRGTKCRGSVFEPDSSIRCQALGHEKCSWHTAVYNMQKRRSLKNGDGQTIPLDRCVDGVYGEARIAIAWLHSDLAWEKFSSALTRLRKRRTLAESFRDTIGVPVRMEEGWSFALLVRDGDSLDLDEIYETWADVAGPTACVEGQDTDPRAKPSDLFAELWCMAQQAIPLLVAEEAITPEDGLLSLEQSYGEGNYRIMPGFKDTVAKLPASNQPKGKEDWKYADSTRQKGPSSSPSAPFRPCLCDTAGCELKPAGKFLYLKLRSRIKNGRFLELPDGRLVTEDLFRFLYPKGW